MGKIISSRSLTDKDLRRYGNCFVWVGSSAQALRPRPPAKPTETDPPAAKPETPSEKGSE
jgi:hypothetical protein